jgi:hypothetical protein
LFQKWRTLLQPIVVDSEEVLAAGVAAETVGAVVTVADAAAGVAAAVDAAAGAAKRRRSGSR